MKINGVCEHKVIKRISKRPSRQNIKKKNKIGTTLAYLIKFST